MANLREELDQAKAETQVLHDIANATTFQHIVDSLAEHLLSAQAAIASLWLLEPAKLTSPAMHPFQYAILRGLYLRDSDFVGGIGTRLTLAPDDPLLATISQSSVALNAANFNAAAQSPLLHTLLKTCPVEDWSLFPLRASEHVLGVLFVGLEGSLSAAEQQTYTRICRVLSLYAAAQQFERSQAMMVHERDILLNTINDGVLITNTEGVIIAANDTFRRLFNYGGVLGGITLNDLLGRLQIPPTVRQQLVVSWGHLMTDTHTPQQGDFSMVTHQGQPIEIRWSSTPMIDPRQQTVFAWLFVFHDVTPERTAVQVRSAFLSRISHELRTPLTSISGFAESILEAAGDDLPQVAREYVEIIHDSAGTLKQIFSELIEITGAQTGELTLNLQPADLKTVVEAVIKKYEPAARARHQTIHTNFADDLPQVHIDTERIGRVFSSLLWNAIQYTHPEGEIFVALQTANTADDLPPGAPPDTITPALVASVIDSGDGIQERDAEQVFEPFYRTKNAWMNQAEGTGLGLAISRSLVELHRGKIWLQPAAPYHKGGRFFLTLPT